MDDKRLDAMEKRMSAGGPNSSNPYKRYFVCLCHSPPWDQSYKTRDSGEIPSRLHLRITKEAIQSRSKILSTRGIKTLAAMKRVERGTSVNMAPQLLPTKYSKTLLTVKDMMDVFPFGMLIHTTVNLKEPFKGFGGGY